MDDSVAKDAKRLLLRYGAPISVVDQLSDDERITYARSIIRTAVPDRPAQLRDLLSEDGRMTAR
jgi:protein-L-isoaspartate O-methyltransferase